MTQPPGVHSPTIEAEHTKAIRVNAAMQAISAVPMFVGAPGELEFFLSRMDLIVEQITSNNFDLVTNNYLLGYFYSRISMEVLQDTGITCGLPWDGVKSQLREKYGGASRSTPRLILREVLIPRDGGESAAAYAKTVMRGFRKVQNRLKDSITDEAERRVRIAMLEELASEMLTQNLPRRVKQWVKISKPTSLEKLVKTVEDDETEEREERWEEPRRRIAPRRGEEKRPERVDGWQRVQRRQKEFAPVAPQTRERPQNRELRRERTEKKSFRKSGNTVRAPRSRECWECKEPGHFARECPYIYRRNVAGGNSYARPNSYERRDEPMEVNATRRRRYESDSESDASTSSSQVSGRSYADRVRGPFRRLDRTGPPLLGQTAEKDVKTKAD